MSNQGSSCHSPITKNITKKLQEIKVWRNHLQKVVKFKFGFCRIQLDATSYVRQLHFMFHMHTQVVSLFLSASCTS